MILGKSSDPGKEVALGEEAAGMDNALEFLYGDDSAMKSRKFLITGWLEDIEKYFPGPIVALLQKEAIGRLDLKDLLHSAALLATLEPNKNLVLNLLQAKELIPEETRGEARNLVRRYIDKVREKYFFSLREKTRGAIRSGRRTYNPRPVDIDWKQTIRLNLKNYLPEYNTIVPTRVVGNTRTRQRTKHFFVLVDQSYSMAHSAIYAGIASSVLASLPLLKTRLIVFDTEMAELTDFLQDPVDLLFGIQMGGGTHITPVLEFVERETAFPSDTYILLISDLYEGYSEKRMLEVFRRLTGTGVRTAVLLSFAEKRLADYDKKMGQALSALQIPVLGCSVELFPDMIEAFFRDEDLLEWAVRNEVQKVR